MGKEELIARLKAPNSGIDHPEFDLEEASGKVTGVLISKTFEGMSQLDRQDLVWNYLKGVFDPGELLDIVVLITVTPNEQREALAD